MTNLAAFQSEPAAWCGEDYVPGPNVLPPRFADLQTSPLRLRGRDAVRSSLVATLELRCCPLP